MPSARALRICETELTEKEQAIIDLRSDLEPDFVYKPQSRCRKLNDAEASDLAQTLEKKLLKRGIACRVSAPTHTKLRFQECKLTQEYIDKYGYNISGYSGRRARYLGWEDWVDFHNTVNDTLDDKKIFANISSKGAGGFVIREGLERKTEEDWEESFHKNVGSQMKPISIGELYTPEKGGRDKFIQDRDLIKDRALGRTLEKIKNELPDVVDFDGREFTKSFYSLDGFSTQKYPTRSKEIIWEDEDGNQIYLFENDIEYIKNGFRK